MDNIDLTFEIFLACIPESWCTILSYIWLIWFSNILLWGIDLWLCFFGVFFWLVFGFSIGVMLIEGYEKCLPSVFFQSVYIDFFFSLNVWYNSPEKSSGPGVFFMGRFLITYQISFIDTRQCRFSLFSWVFLVICVFQDFFSF